ncbi:winged helix-turn-helix transcriptional regulator [Terriglobus sp.]|uniref:winged helix-turn-helix transcriptional regulator n=1 Tax=Terriglobus sp. TaxID=1889013 RepID=UPI003AFF9B85
MKQISKDAVLGPVALTCRSEETEPLREFLARVGDKWSILLVVTLSRKPNHRARFSELQKSIDGISQRMLTTTLRQLERDGLLSREVFPEVPPRVEYELTRLGSASWSQCGTWSIGSAAVGARASKQELPSTVER